MELSILVATQPFILSHEMGEHQGWKVGTNCWAEWRHRPSFSPPIVGENCGRTLTWIRIENTYFRCV